MSEEVSSANRNLSGQLSKEPQHNNAPPGWSVEGGSDRTVPHGETERMEYQGYPSLAVPMTRTTGLHQIAMLGNHLPRQCGIATFTADLCEAIVGKFSAIGCSVLAMNDTNKRYMYPERVRFEIATTNLASYRHAADSLNVGSADLLSVQHEYGIFGGNAGSHVLTLLREVRLPIVTTLHTVLSKPNVIQRRVMNEITELSERLVVMSASGASLLHDIYDVPDTKIDVIPHGIPTLPSVERSRRRLRLEDKSVLMTFGLLSPVKGIEHVIDALPAIVDHYPSTIYIVLGATHPCVKERYGEQYRVMLEDRARQLGVGSNVVFHNRFVSHDEITEFLAATDIYITPYLDPEQITSGTLAYALGSGKPVISTPYSYARELLSGGHGILVPWPKKNDPGPIAGAVIELLGDDKRRDALHERGVAYGRNMLWPEVARSYVSSFERALVEYNE